MQAGSGRTCMVQGRIVWTVGKTVFEGKVKTIFGTQQPQLNAQGQQQLQYGFGLAIPKTALSQMGPGQPGEIWAALHAEAQAVYPSGQIPPGFAMKYKDGDGVDDKGVPFAQRAGYQGHIVLACTTNLPIKFFRFENGQNILINEGIKCGDYVNVQVSIKGHPASGAGKAGLYVNPQAVQFLGYGEAIVNAPSGDQIFGTNAPPQMGSAVPIAPNGQLVPSGMPVAPQMPGFQGVPAPQAPPVQQAPAQPHYGVVPPQFAPPPGGQPMGNVPPAAPAPQWNAQPATMPPTQYPGVPAAPAAQPSYPMTPGQVPVAPSQNPGNGMPPVPGWPPQQ